MGLREDLLKTVLADLMSLTEFDEAVFKEQIDYIDVLSATELVFHFKDGRAVSRTWVKPKRKGTPWTDEQRAKIMRTIKDKYTPERRKQMSEHMKQIRKERGREWFKKE